MNTKNFLLSVAMLAAFAGTAQAAAPSLNKAMRGTWRVTVNGNYVATVNVLPNGLVKATQPNGDKDTGHWRISPNDRYCVTFNKWLDRKEHCSDISIDSKGVAHGNGFSASR